MFRLALKLYSPGRPAWRAKAATDRASAVKTKARSRASVPGPGARIDLLGEPAKDVAHHAQKLQRAGVADAIEHAVSILAGAQHAFVAKNGEVLRDIALRSADMVDDVLDADFLVAQHAENFQTQRM